MKKVVLKLDLHDDQSKKKAMKTVSTLQGIDSIAMDMKEMKMTVIGAVDPVQIVSKLRKYWTTELLTVGPAKEPEKKEEPKKEEAKKDEPKKEEGGDKKDAAAAGGEKKEEPKKDAAAAGGGEKKEEPKKEEVKKEGEVKKEDAPKPDPVLELVKAYRAYNPHMTTYYHVQSIEENPNACVVC